MYPCSTCAYTQLKPMLLVISSIEPKKKKKRYGLYKNVKWLLLGGGLIEEVASPMSGFTAVYNTLPYLHRFPTILSVVDKLMIKIFFFDL